ncbi:MAG TPA: glycerol-3-phosphate responsive antiterminator [Negativicutes bacterium]|nr:glycerol-3-phosphate responsive antiterminator [Negativicutes bacterium]
MARTGIAGLIKKGAVIPAARSVEDFEAAVLTNSPAIIVLFGDINELPRLVRRGQECKKHLIVHLDLFEGIGKDRSGVRFLARTGMPALITIKPQLGKIARDEGLVVIQRLFLMDSESLRTGINMLKGFKPDAVEILPALVPGEIVHEIIREIDIPVLAGGLIRTADDVAFALRNGVYAVSTSRRGLWK